MAATERPFSSRGPSVAGGGIPVRSEAHLPDRRTASNLLESRVGNGEPGLLTTDSWRADPGAFVPSESAGIPSGEPTRPIALGSDKPPTVMRLRPGRFHLHGHHRPGAGRTASPPIGVSVPALRRLTPLRPWTNWELP